LRKTENEKEKKNHTFLLFLEIGFRKYTLTQKWKQRELGFLDESSEREREREREREESWCLE
jgi:hypothetical protein